MWGRDFPLVFGSIGKLQQVLMNLLSNAKDALESSPLKEIHLKTQNEGEWVVLLVEDTGPGVPKELQEKIFDMFFTTKKRGEGTGLGLGISYSIIEDFKGRIEVDQQRTKGGCFKVYLPLAAPQK